MEEWGRLLIPLYLVSKGILQKPILYLSDFFERNRNLYYDNLMVVREKNNLSQWFKFFLVGVIETSKNGIRTFENILQLQKQVDSEIQKMGSRGINAKKVLDYLYNKPLINAAKVSEVTGISMPSSYKLISDLEKIRVLKEITGGQRSRMYVFANYLNIFK